MQQEYKKKILTFFTSGHQKNAREKKNQKRAVELKSCERKEKNITKKKKGGKEKYEKKKGRKKRVEKKRVEVEKKTIDIDQEKKGKKKSPQKRISSIYMQNQPMEGSSITSDQNHHLCHRVVKKKKSKEKKSPQKKSILNIYANQPTVDYQNHLPYYSVVSNPIHLN